MAKAMEKRTCERCKKTINIDNFYISNRIDRYPDNGLVTKCKSCYTAHINNWEPSTYQSLLEDIDVPYIPSEWNALLDRYGEDPKKTSTVAIFGRYLAKMKLRQYSDYSYADTDKIALEEEKKKQMAVARDEAYRLRYAAAGGQNPLDLVQGDISALSDEDIALLFPQPDEATHLDIMTDKPKSSIPQTPSVEDRITAEDRMALMLKWGKLYSVDEWLYMEKLYRDMMDSYEIATASHLDYLKMICKTSLRMNQAIDCNDFEGYAKLQKAYDTLMKSAKFTAAQNKSETQNEYEAVCELILLAEEVGFIPQFDISVPQDIVDFTMADMNKYVFNLVTKEQGLGNLIETAVAAMQRQEEEMDDEAGFEDLDEILDYEAEIQDEDYEEFYDFLEEEESDE